MSTAPTRSRGSTSIGLIKLKIGNLHNAMMAVAHDNVVPPRARVVRSHLRRYPRLRVDHRQREA